MARQDWDLQPTEYNGEHWRATFFLASEAHSIFSGTAWEPTPWTAVGALARAESAASS